MPRSGRFSTVSTRPSSPRSCPIVEAEIRNGTADPITDDIHGLVRTLAATTALHACPVSRPSWAPARDMDAAVQILEKLWLRSLWGGRIGG